MTRAAARCSAPFLLLCLALAVGGGGRQSTGLQAAAAAEIPGLPCSALVDTDVPEQWQPVGDVPSVRLAALSLLSRHYDNVGGPAACGPLASNPDTDILILGACAKGSLTALLIYGRFTCTGQTCANNQPCVYGAKLLGTARALPGKEPGVTQLDPAPVAPSIPPAQGTATVQRAGVSYLQSQLEQSVPLNFNYKELIAKSTKQVSAIYKKTKAGSWRLSKAEAATFGAGYGKLVPRPPSPPRRPPPPPSPPPIHSYKQVRRPPRGAAIKSAGSPGARSLLQSVGCADITGLDGFVDATGTVPPSFIASSLQAAFLTWYTAAGPEAAQTCPQIYDPTTKKINLAAVQTDVMQVCRKETPTGVTYGMRFTAYFPCAGGQGRYEVLDSTVHQPLPTHAAAFGPIELLSQPPNSTAGIGWGADTGVSSRLRLQADFTCVSSIQATDIAVDPSDPNNIWIVGPVDESSVNPACGKPYGGPLLKWDWARSAFKPAPNITAAGMRVTIMPETHMPWIVDGCGQLHGWSAQGKRLFGPAPSDQQFDIASVNGTVFSGCSFYNPSTYEGNIAAGCGLSVAVGPNGALYTSDSAEIAVTASGDQLLANGQDVLYKDPQLQRTFRAYRPSNGYQPVRIAAGGSDVAWLVVAPPAQQYDSNGQMKLLTTLSTPLAGVYRAFIRSPGQPKPPNWPTTCANVDPGCADGGCNAELTRCVRCAPQYAMGADGKCRPLVCTDADPNCAECGEGALCITCAPGFVRGYHSGDTLCRRPIKGSVTCWSSATGGVVQPLAAINSSSWQQLASIWRGVVLVDTAGTVETIWDKGQTPDIRYSNFAFRLLAVDIPQHGRLRAASPIDEGELFTWLGLTHRGALGYLWPSGVTPPAAQWILTHLSGDGQVLTFSTQFVRLLAVACWVTVQGTGRCDVPINLLHIGTVHATCFAAADVVCFLGVYGDVRCRTLAPFPGSPKFSAFLDITFMPPDGMRWVEIVCGSYTVCARPASGPTRCFSLPGNTFKSPAQLPSDDTMLAAYHTPHAPSTADRQRFCGIDAAQKLQCIFTQKNGSSEASKLVNFDGAWAAVAVTYDSVCAISA